MPVYARAEGKWLVRIYAKGRPLTWIVNGTRADAELHEAKMRVELVAAPQLRSVPAFSRYCLDHYAPDAKLRLKASWYQRQKSILTTLITFFGDDKIDRIDRAAIDQFARQRTRDKLRASSVNNEVRVLLRVLGHAAERHVLARVPEWRSLPERDKREQRAWSAEDLQRLLACASEHAPELVAVIVFLANTGCRRGEALALTWDCVDLERGLVMIRPSAEWQPKNGKPREVPISDALRPWLDPERGRLDIPAHAAAPRSRYVFPPTRMRGGELGRWSCWPARAFDRVRDLAELEGGVHTLRHTFATHFLAAVPDLYLLARILGHSDVAVTRLYSHLLPDHLARARNAVSVPATVTPGAIAGALRARRAAVQPPTHRRRGADRISDRIRSAPDDA